MGFQVATRNSSQNQEKESGVGREVSLSSLGVRPTSLNGREASKGGEESREGYQRFNPGIPKAQGRQGKGAREPTAPELWQAPRPFSVQLKRMRPALPLWCVRVGDVHRGHDICRDYRAADPKLSATVHYLVESLKILCNRHSVSFCGPETSAERLNNFLKASLSHHTRWLRTRIAIQALKAYVK